MYNFMMIGYSRMFEATDDYCKSTAIHSKPDLFVCGWFYSLVKFSFKGPHIKKNSQTCLSPLVKQQQLVVHTLSICI